MVEQPPPSTSSSTINSAYKTLRDPYQRAIYLLAIQYNITIDEGKNGLEWSALDLVESE